MRSPTRLHNLKKAEHPLHPPCQPTRITRHSLMLNVRSLSPVCCNNIFVFYVLYPWQCEGLEYASRWYLQWWVFRHSNKKRTFFFQQRFAGPPVWPSVKQSLDSAFVTTSNNNNNYISNHHHQQQQHEEKDYDKSEGEREVKMRERKKGEETSCGEKGMIWQGNRRREKWGEVERGKKRRKK